MTSKVSIRSGLGSLPLDPPPFFLHREIRLPASRAWVSSVIVGVAILTTYALFFYDPGQTIPRLSWLMVVSVAAGTLYLGVRFVAYQAAWLWVTRKHSGAGRISPSARGELPRNAFLVVLVAPGLAFVTACLLALRAKADLGVELWLAIAVVAGITLGDLRAARHLASVESACWVKRTPRGLDVLKPVEGI